MNKKVLLILMYRWLITASLAEAQQIADFEEYGIAAGTFLNGSDGAGGFSSGAVFLPNNYNSTFDAWLGWSLSAVQDTSTRGFTNQYSCISGAGAEGSTVYALGYAFDPVILHLSDTGTIVLDAYLNNATYPYHSMREGDAFSKRFGGSLGNDPDFFKLTIRKYYRGILHPDSLEFYLADYRFVQNDSDYIVKEWTIVDLSSLGKADSLSFSLASSDVGIFGMNTPAYFCLDRIRTPAEITRIKEYSEHNLVLYPNPATSFINIDLPPDKTGHLTIRDAQGSIVKTQPFFSSGPISLELLSPGMYFSSFSDGKTTMGGVFLKMN